MNPLIETPFRITFGLLWVIYFGVRLFFQRRISGQKEYTHVNERQEKLLFRLFALAFILLPLYFLTPWVDFASTSLPLWLRWGGGIIVCLEIVLFGWAHQVLGQNWTAILALAKEHEMVQNGPYRYVRHPMYSAFFVIGIGFGILSANWLIGIVYLAPLLVMYAMRVSTEEKMMIDRFGEPYREYMKHTGRLFPRLWV
jgi:protein-S-isoprenylcysteine O-methyltransferase Ste14